MTIKVENFFDTLITTFTNILNQSNNINDYYKDDSSDICSFTTEIASHANQNISTLKSLSSDRTSETKRILGELLSPDSKEMQSLPILNKIWSSLQAEPGYPTQPFKDESIDFNKLNEITAPLKEAIDSIKTPLNIDINSLYQSQEDEDEDEDKSDDEEAPAELKQYINKVLSICNLHCLINSLSDYNNFLQENYESLNNQDGEAAKSIPSPDPELLNKISSLESQITEKDNQISELHQKITSLETENANSAEQIKKLQEEIESKNKDLESKNKDEEEFKKLKEQNEDLQTQIYNLNNALQDKEHTINELRSAPKPLPAIPQPLPVAPPIPPPQTNNEEVEKLKAQLKDVEDRNNFWRQTQEQEQSRLREQIMQKDDELKKKQEELQKLILDSKGDETKKLNEDLKNQLHWKDEDLKKLQVEIQKYQQVDAQHKEEIQKLNEQAQGFAQLQATNQTLQNNLQQYQLNYGKLQQINKNLNQKGITVTRQLQSANQQILQLQQQLQEKSKSNEQEPKQEEQKLEEQKPKAEEEQKSAVQPNSKQIEQYETAIRNLRAENAKLKRIASAANQQKKQISDNQASTEALKNEVAKLKEQLKVLNDARNHDQYEASNRAALAQRIGYEIKRYTDEYL
ncbi:hypothetical protein M9Y10_001860 [Tritrichomonas musculus]|uniref:Viral A-type inclusion protein n=1 Tax=Tritrichomonas musculus TaxID=1915356 RepID=A0ABR2L855_9EUKA